MIHVNLDFSDSLFTGDQLLRTFVLMKSDKSILFIGENLEYLKAYAQQIDNTDIKVHFISENFQDEINSIQFVKIIIIDVDSCQTNIKSRLKEIYDQFPESQIWGIFNSKSTVLSNNLIDMGMTRLLSHDENINDLLIGY